MRVFVRNEKILFSFRYVLGNSGFFLHNLPNILVIL